MTSYAAGTNTGRVEPPTPPTAPRITSPSRNRACLYALVVSLAIGGSETLRAGETPGIANARVRDLVQKLHDNDATRRRDAAWELGALRSEAEAAIEPLGKACGDADHGVRRAAVLALFRIGPPAMEKQPWMRKIGMEPITADAAATTFDRLWEAVDREYAMFVIRPEVKWDALRRRYRPEALTAQSDTELALIASDMLSHLRDQHVWLKVRGRNVPIYSRKYPGNWNRNSPIYEKLVGPPHWVGKKVFWARTPDKIGWVVILDWSDADRPDEFDEALEQMRDTRGLIVDARSNGGGDSLLASMVAARFADRPRAYMHYRYRTGPEHTDLAKRIARMLAPRGPWRYDRPVVLLQGRKCVSANESFCAQMAACPNVTTMGGPTKGSTGSPVWFEAGSGIEVAVPQWIAYLPNGEVFDEKGVPPDVLFEYRPDAFAGDKDDLMSTALAKLRREPLPAQPIGGASIQEVRARRAAEKAQRPQVISIEPKDGATDIDPRTAIRIRFDRPMHPTTASLQWESGGLRRCERIRYDEKSQEFALPLRLEPGCTHRIVINAETKGAGPCGFQSACGTPACRYEWSFTTSGPSSGDAAENAPSAATRSVRSVVEAFNRTRATMASFVETVATIECAQLGPQGFCRLRAYAAVFNLQGPQEYLADVSDACGRPTVLFSDGALNHICGYYRQGRGDPDAVFCRSEEISRQQVTLADPFDWRSGSAEAVCAQLKLRHGGTIDFEGRRCHVVESRPGGDESSRQWWIDADSHLLVRVVSHDDAGRRTTSWPAFAHVNEPQPHMETIPNASYQAVSRHKRMAEPLPDGSTARFMEISDGSRSPIRARWGPCDPPAKQYAGL